MDFYSTLLSFLAGVTVRSLVLVAAAAAALWVFRVTGAAARHAAWTVALVGMLLLAALGPVMPPIALRVLQPPAQALPLRSVTAPHLPAALAAAPIEPAPAAAPLPEPRTTWQQIAAALYALVTIFFLARLAFGYLFTVRLVRACRRLTGDWPEAVYESSWISVPLTVGWLRPKILLPSGWGEWTRDKMDAVMAHERTHIARGDWAISILSGLNRCLFWFNPLAWWLERSLASLAEQACDDASLLLVESGSYAQALLEMAAAVKTGQGRLVWEAMAMAKAAEVRKRIDRILDETRQIPRAVTRSRWIALLACSLPLIYVTAVVRVEAQEPKTQAAMAEFLKGKRQFSAADVNKMEEYLKVNPSDLEVRSQLVTYYFASNTGREQRFAHIHWVVANAPESDVAVYVSHGISPRSNSLNDPSDYARIAVLWRQQAAARPKDARVLDNAGQFFAQPGGDFEEAERYFLAERAIDSRTQSINRLADLYVRAILGATGDNGYAKADGAFANRVKQKLEGSEDLLLVRQSGSLLASAARRPTPAAPLKAGETNLDDHPLLLDAVDFGGRLLARSGNAAMTVATNGVVQQFSTQTALIPLASAADAAAPQAPAPVSKIDPVYPPLAKQARIQGQVRMVVKIGGDGTIENLSIVSGHPLLVPAAIEALKQWRFPTGSAGTYTMIVPFTLADAPVYSPVFPPAGSAAPPAPMPVSRVEPVYPPLARQARIQGVVTMGVKLGGDGGVENLSVVNGHPLLIPSAIEALKQWRFPTGAAGTYTVTLPFTLADEPGFSPQSPQAGVTGGVQGGVQGAVPKGLMPQRIKVGGNVQSARVKEKVEPEYPALARQARISGDVVLEVVIGKDGVVESARPISGHPLLAAAARDAVMKWIYVPTTLNDVPVEVMTNVTIPFRLEQ